MARRRRRTTLRRHEVIGVLMAHRARVLGVAEPELVAAIANTDRERLLSLVTVDGELACSLRPEGELYANPPVWTERPPPEEAEAGG